MARFSLGREDDSDGPSSPDPKRQRTTTTTRTLSPPPQNPTRHRSRLFTCQESDLESSEDFYVDEEEEEEIDEEEEEEEEIDEEEEEENEVEEEEVDGGVEFRDEVQRGKVTMVEKSESSQNARCTGDSPISVILSDPDVLDCSICLEPLTAPVFQCENGHIACNCCCRKLKNKCPSCCHPIGYNRCRAIEKVIESIKISCQNMKYGCKQTVPYNKKHEHDHACAHAPASCPHDGCNFVDSSKKLYQHFRSTHYSSAIRFSYNKVFSVGVIVGHKHVVLQEMNDNVIFIFNYSREGLGTLVNVNCIGPTTTEKGYSYELTAKIGETSIVLKSVTENVPNWVEHRSKKAFLVVPREFESGSSGSHLYFKVEVCIRKPS